MQSVPKRRGRFSLTHLHHSPPQIRMLAGLVFGLFGLMHLGAGVAWALDKNARKDVLRQLLALRARNAATGAEPGAEAPWAWLFTLVRLSSLAGAPLCACLPVRVPSVPILKLPSLSDANRVPCVFVVLAPPRPGPGDRRRRPRPGHFRHLLRPRRDAHDPPPRRPAGQSARGRPATGARAVPPGSSTAKQRVRSWFPRSVVVFLRGCFATGVVWDKFLTSSAGGVSRDCCRRLVARRASPRTQSGNPPSTGAWRSPRSTGKSAGAWGPCGSTTGPRRAASRGARPMAALAPATANSGARHRRRRTSAPRSALGRSAMAGPRSCRSPNPSPAGGHAARAPLPLHRSGGSGLLREATALRRARRRWMLRSGARSRRGRPGLAGRGGALSPPR